MELPNKAAIRIVENPHSMPHVPQNLTDLVARNRHQEILCGLQQTSYSRRRERWDLERLRRMAVSQSAIDSDSDDELTAHPSNLVFRRSSSMIEHGYRKHLPCKEDLQLKTRQNSS